MEGPINLLYIIYSLNNGGAETLAIRLAEQLNKNCFNFNVVICSLSDTGPLRKVINEKGIPLVSLGKKEGKDFSIVRKLRRVLKDKNIDIIHTHNQGPLLYAFLATLFSRRYRLVHTEHINMLKEFSYSKKHLFYNKFLYRRLDGFVSIAQHLTNDFISQYDLRRVSVSTILNSVEMTPQPMHAALSLRRELGLSDHARIIGNISALRPQKDHATLIRAMAKVVAQMPQAYLVIAGDGELRQELQHLANQLNIPDNVKFLGYRSDVNELLSQFDLFVLSSLYEGLPLCVLEAMAAAKPIVATDADGTNELIINRSTGILVPIKDPATMADALVNLLTDPLMAAGLAQKALQAVQEKYNMEKMVKQYEQHYFQLLKQ